ncbi:serine/threonine-protein kinase [Micromonospora sp. M71_S20]|uniref:serine/threonine-protein kinase n=1 Tax=Micromonospora sp. M71_S20 TaxID=592872 RepID=UPI000EB43E4B|nr:serine/threonine-protein kinase [Micromonospora sp. M71_S20]RLK25045.1 serine/threonine-protein kinase [Micromonospora sp. M71_S20]
MSPFSPTLRLHDRYVLRERIGLGGMSEVWRADDEVLHRPVAVKALTREFATDPQLRATIQREARAAARLTHPHVTQVYDYGEAALDGGIVVPYLVMELVEGRSLADRLAAGPLPWPEAVRMAGQIAAALAAAHRIGVVHRDVKPGNVMLTETGAKVLDFGIAALAGPHHPRAGQTGELLMGTPAYFAPERMRPGPPNPASDVYALGALLYRTLTGRAPLPVQTWEDALEVHAGHPPVPPPRVPGLPPDIAELTLACLATDPARRPSAAQLAARFGPQAPAHPTTAVLPTVSAGASSATSPSSASAEHPPTLIDRSPPSPNPTGTGRAGVPYPAPPGGRHPVVARPGRPAPAGGAGATRNRPGTALVAVGVALLVGLVGALVLGDGGSPPPAAAPATGAPAAKPTSSRPTPTPTRTSAPPPVTARPEPVGLPQFVAEFAAVLAWAQARGEIDRKTVEGLRDKLADLSRGKQKDRAKRVEQLRERLAEAAEEGQIPPDTAARLDALLDRVATPSQDDGEDDD